jgi:O-succinylbenzoate synthase
VLGTTLLSPKRCTSWLSPQTAPHLDTIVLLQTDPLGRSLVTTAAMSS